MSDVVSLTVNGTPREVTVATHWTLADLLRTGLGLTGTHLGCEQGVCGSCTVLLDNKTVRGCLTLALQAEGRSVLTVEGLENDDGSLHPVQEAFAKHHALQCGFCTPGFLMTAVEMIAEGVEPDDKVIRQRISGNLCRCTGYHNIVSALIQLLEPAK